MTLLETVKKYKWYHKIDLGNGIVTPGPQPLCLDAYQIPDRLDGLRVLDVGAWDGLWTFEALKRGAREVIAIDDWSDLPWVDTSVAENPRVQWDTFDLCKTILNYSDEQCKRYTMSIYDAEKLGKFDVVFFFGVLYHCRHPLLALDVLSKVCTKEIYVESAICDDYSPHRNPDMIGAGYANRTDVVMEFYPNSEYGGIGSNWWCPTLICLKLMVQSAGFKDVETWKYDRPKELCYCRGFAKGKK